MTPEELPRLLSLISHELSGPIGVVRGYLRLLEQRETGSTDDHRAAVRAAMKAAGRATELLADLSRLGRLLREPSTERIAIPVADLVTHSARQAVLPSDPVVRLEIEQLPHAVVAAEPSLLPSSVGALITAVAAAQPRETLLTISAATASNETAAGVRLTVRRNEVAAEDTGERPLDLTRGGLGLSLPIALAVVRAHGGWVNEVCSRDQLSGMVLWLPTQE